MKRNKFFIRMGTAAIAAVMLLCACNNHIPPQTDTSVISDTPTATSESPLSQSSSDSSSEKTSNSDSSTFTSSSKTTTSSDKTTTSSEKVTTVTSSDTTAFSSVSETTEKTSTEKITTTEKSSTAAPKKTTVTTTAKPAEPSPPIIKTPVASGSKAEVTDDATLDYSNSSKGYIMCKYTGGKKTSIKVLLTSPKGTQYQYDLSNGGNYETFGLTEGSGSYTVGIYENVSGDSYAVLLKKTIKVSLGNGDSPFLTPNQYVNYNESSSCVTLASKLCAGKTNDIEKIEAIYTWLVDNVDYDKALAASVKSGYLPDTERTVTDKMGICTDYAGTMAAMLRSQGICAKLVFGYAGDAYHAWVLVKTSDKGNVSGSIKFNGSGYVRMDPTFAASNDNSDAILDYIGDGNHYSDPVFIY